MTKTYTVTEVLELQNKKQQLEQRLEIHKQRAAEKQKELTELFAAEGVSSIQELSSLCATTNQAMQEYAFREEANVAKMQEDCDALDRML